MTAVPFVYERIYEALQEADGLKLPLLWLLVWQPTQELQEQQLAKQVTLAMGLFPFSMLGRTVGRRRFRPLYQRFRRTRSTASDTALNDSYGELTLSSAGVMAAYTLPHNLHFNRSGSEVGNLDTESSLQYAPLLRTCSVLSGCARAITVSASPPSARGRMYAALYCTFSCTRVFFPCLRIDLYITCMHWGILLCSFADPKMPRASVRVDRGMRRSGSPSRDPWYT